MVSFTSQVVGLGEGSLTDRSNDAKRARLSPPEEKSVLLQSQLSDQRAEVLAVHFVAPGLKKEFDRKGHPVATAIRRYLDGDRLALLCLDAQAPALSPQDSYTEVLNVASTPPEALVMTCKNGIVIGGAPEKRSAFVDAVNSCCIYVLEDGGATKPKRTPRAPFPSKEFKPPFNPIPGSFLVVTVTSEQELFDACRRHAPIILLILAHGAHEFLEARGQGDLLGAEQIQRRQPARQPTIHQPTIRLLDLADLLPQHGLQCVLFASCLLAQERLSHLGLLSLRRPDIPWFGAVPVSLLTHDISNETPQATIACLYFTNRAQHQAEVVAFDGSLQLVLQWGKEGLLSVSLSSLFFLAGLFSQEFVLKFPRYLNMNSASHLLRLLSQLEKRNPEIKITMALFEDIIMLASCVANVPDHRTDLEALVSQLIARLSELPQDGSALPQLHKMAPVMENLFRTIHRKMHLPMVRDLADKLKAIIAMDADSVQEDWQRDASISCRRRSVAPRTSVSWPYSSAVSGMLHSRSNMPGGPCPFSPPLISF